MAASKDEMDLRAWADSIGGDVKLNWRGDLNAWFISGGGMSHSCNNLRMGLAMLAAIVSDLKARGVANG